MVVRKKLQWLKVRAWPDHVHELYNHENSFIVAYQRVKRSVIYRVFVLL